MFADRLRKAWEERRGSHRVDVVMRFSDEGLVLGAGTLLAACGASSRAISIDPREPRLLALLAAAHLRKPTAGALTHLRKAAECWSEGEDALASMHLVLSQLDRLRRPGADAHRLFLADILLREGVEPDTMVDLVGADGSGLELVQRAYNPDQPRVPSGNGVESGRWTSDDDALGEPQAEVNPNSVTLVAEPYAGPDACYRAKLDCYRNIGKDMYSHGNANDNMSYLIHSRILLCLAAEDACETVGFLVERTPFFRRGTVIYPDGGIVFTEKGWIDDYVYIPAGTRQRNFSFRRTL